MNEEELKKRQSKLMEGITEALLRSRNNINLEIQFASCILNKGSELSNAASPFFYQTAVTSSERIEDEAWYIESKKSIVKTSEEFRNSNIRWHVKRVDSQNNNEYLIVTYNTAGGVAAVGFKW